ncbi:Dip2/Utp12 family-domain-containing protein [Pseudoneurospora amorphoporcata]|uniref:Dip2/Utp12 family-domain-containing protein n=1 Tax=Pseudoneurospora amorphoporcata TaxID=241081 RepID=A0AAN6NW55_9PEZI|nr:Dip2/Utp12 family-domain-containing protein [Pseudoneurospora amorphoporcata]
MSTKRKALTLVKPVVKPSAKVATKSKIDETRTAVSTGPALKSATKAAPETIEISSDSSSHYSDSDNEDMNSDNEAATEKQSTTTTTTKHFSEPAAQQDEAASDADENDDDDASPTFGDLARGNATIDVASALAAQEAAAVDASKAVTITVQRANGQTTISATSLGTVLNQALRTDDSDLLESCLQTSDPKIITNTITRMDSALAGVLLSKLAARMHRRPGRAFGLMKWIQTTLVAHGGSLVAQPEVVARLGELNRVLEERARGLPALLALKGKLDMLDQQMRWRKFMKQGGGKEEQENGEESEEEDDVDEPGVVYVEGDEDNEGKSVANGAEEDFALIDVGADGESDEEEGDDDDGEEDDEEFDDAESLDEDEVDHDDVEESGDEDEEGDDEDDDEDEAPPAKVQKTSSKFAKRKSKRMVAPPPSPGLNNKSSLNNVKRRSRSSKPKPLNRDK